MTFVGLGGGGVGWLMGGTVDCGFCTDNVLLFKLLPHWNYLKQACNLLLNWNISKETSGQDSYVEFDNLLLVREGSFQNKLYLGHYPNRLGLTESQPPLTEHSIIMANYDFSMKSVLGIEWKGEEKIC